MDDQFRPGRATPDEEVTDRLLDALAAGDQAGLERLVAARPDLNLGSTAAAAAAARQALAVRSTPAVRAQHVRGLMDEAVRRRSAAGAGSPIPGPAKRRARWGWPRRIAVTLAAVVGVGAVGLTATAALAAKAQPGQALYGTRLALENVEADVQFNPAKRVSLRVRFAEERLDELSALLTQGRAGQAGTTARNLAAQERQITTSLVKLAEQGKAPPSLVRTLESDLARHLAKLAGERATSACAVRPRLAACRQLDTAQRTTHEAILRLSQLPGGVAPRQLGASTSGTSRGSGGSGSGGSGGSGGVTAPKLDTVRLPPRLNPARQRRP